MREVYSKLFTCAKNFNRDAKKSRGSLNGGPHSYVTTGISSGNNSSAKTLIEYDNDETLEIKEEIVEARGNTGKNDHKMNESKFCTIYIKEDDILSAENKLRSQKKPKNQDSGQKPEMQYKCDKCARTFSYFNTFYQHQRYDCGVTPRFECKLCGKRFKRTNVMNRHIDHVHRKKGAKKSVLRHNCDKCFRSYNWACDLYRHRSLEHAEVQSEFTCDICGFKFKRKAYLYTHIASKHLNQGNSKRQSKKVI
ncbi:zinc finger protein 626-like [Belonocnema kinseyi]|uniref:zinc finger protein 626-like n=1 Tax=Belonocnema kinseyi TaxID=2817044 RepID=UPI00143D35A9|nr:zinc finger protein 626-like [Belonocnema kinseyi]